MFGLRVVLLGSQGGRDCALTTLCAGRNEVDVVWWRIMHPVSMVVGKFTVVNSSHFY